MVNCYREELCIIDFKIELEIKITNLSLVKKYKEVTRTLKRPKPEKLDVKLSNLLKATCCTEHFFTMSS